MVAKWDSHYSKHNKVHVSTTSALLVNVKFSDAGIYQAELLDAFPTQLFVIFTVTVTGKYFNGKVL